MGPIDFTGIFYLAAWGVGISIGAVLSIVIGIFFGAGTWQLVPPMLMGLAMHIYLKALG